MSLVQNEGYSATVELRLEVDGESFKVAQVGANELVLAEQCRFPDPVDGRIVVTIDGEESVYEVHFYEGISPRNKVVRFF